MDKVYIIKYIPSGHKPGDVIIDESRFYRTFRSAFNTIIEDYMQTIRNYPYLDIEIDEEHGRAKLIENHKIIEIAYISAVEVID